MASAKNLPNTYCLPHTPYTINPASINFNEMTKIRLLYECHQTRLCGLKYLVLHPGYADEWENKTDSFVYIA